MSNSSLSLKIIPNIPDIDKGDNISGVLISALEKSSIILEEHDVICIAHKIFSKAEGCIIKLTEITPSKEAAELGKTLNKDPRKIKKGVIKNPPPTPNKPERTPTMALSNSISTGLIKTWAIGKKTSI